MKRIIFTESQARYILGEALDELKAFHGTSADFDKFNHKKYLSSGFGSQSFGWGTYVTDDIVIAKGYADKSNNASHLMFDGKDISEQEDFESVFSSNTDLESYEIYNLYRMFAANGFSSERVIKQFLKTNSSIEKWMDVETNPKNIESAKEAYNYNLKVISIIEGFVENNRLSFDDKPNMLYEVEIPDDSGSNYLDWYERVSKKQMYKILIGLKKINPKFIDGIAKKNYPFRTTMYGYIKNSNYPKIVDIMVSKEDYSQFFASGFVTDEKTNIGGQIYRYLQGLFGSDKAVSLYLSNVCDFDGIKYKTGTKWRKPDGASEDGHNYVIFDANKVKITKKENVQN